MLHSIKRPALCILAVLALSVLALICTTCPGSDLRNDPGLLPEDFGTGVQLGQSTNDASEAIQQAEGWEVWLISRDELVGRTPRTERPAGLDLVVALFLPLPAIGEAVPDAGELEVINELRLYLAPPNESSLRFRGELLAQVSHTEMIELLGEPTEPVSEGNDGQVHLVYYFALPDQPGKAIKLVSSHYLPDQTCVSLSLAIVDDPS